MRFEFVAELGGRAKGALGPSEICCAFHGVNIPPRLNKKSKTFNWAGGVNLRLKAKAESDGGCVHRDMGYKIWDM